MLNPRRIVIVGGGITGLTVAYRLVKSSHDALGTHPYVVTLIEARSRLGGNIQTVQQDGFLMDGGPDAWVATKPHATALCNELGLSQHVIGTIEQNRKLYVRNKGSLHLLPEGVVLMVPTRVLPFAKTPLLSWSAKARALLDLVLPRREGDSDESIAQFVRRRFGQELLQQLGDPLLGGIYAGDVEALSIQSTFPQLVEMERKHGSLIRGAFALQKDRALTGSTRSVFDSLSGGVGELVQALIQAIQQRGGQILTATRVMAIRPIASSPELASAPRFAVQLSGESLQADHVVLATPAHVAADCVSAFDLDLATNLRLLPYLSSASVLLGYRRADIHHPLNAAGMIVPKSEGRRALAITFASSKWTERAAQGTALVRVFLGGHREPQVLLQDDETLAHLARMELRVLLGIVAQPLVSRVFRFDRANAQPTLGHATRMLALRQRTAHYPGLHFVGAGYDGVGIPDCIRQATEVAQKIVRSDALAAREKGD